MKKLLILIMMLVCGPALASGGGGGGGPTDILKMDPLVVNLSEGHYIQFTPQLKLGDPTKADFVKAHAPVIRHTLILKLIGKDVNVVQTAQFMAKFSEEAAEAINEALHGEQVHMLLFDGWLIQ